ncbi:MAG: SDR family NAD(P)-dependent oxidoreductase [Acidimicrobiales bacterium]
MTDLRGARVLVTGASGGLGHAIARSLSGEGATLVLTGRRINRLQSLGAELGALVVAADLARRSDLDRLLCEAGDLDVMVANAAVPASGELDGWRQDQIDRAIEINLASPIAMTRSLLPRFLERGSGHFVYISSLAGKAAPTGAPLYAATKFGLRGFACSLRCDLRGTGVGCSVVLPGFVRDAGMFADSGATLPPGVGTVTPAAVATAVVTAVRRDKAEIGVAPAALRAGAVIGSVAPGLSAAVQARVGRKVARRIAEGQREKR